MIVSDILHKSEEDLARMLEEIDNEPIDWTPVVVAVLTLKSTERLHTASTNLLGSSQRIESLTKWLIALTIVLGILAAPPAIEALLGQTNGSSHPAKLAAPSHVGAPGMSSGFERDYQSIIPVKSGRVDQRDWLALDRARRDLLDLRLARAATAGDSVAKDAQLDIFVWKEQGVDLLRHVKRP